MGSKSINITVDQYILIRKTIVEMLYDRSEQVLTRFFFKKNSLDYLNNMPIYSIQKLVNDTTSQNDPTLLDLELKNEKQRVIVKFITNIAKFNNQLNSILIMYNIRPIDKLIIVIITDMKPKDDIFELDLKNIEVFWYKMLTYNVTKHEYVPKHRLLNHLEKIEIKKKLNLNNFNELPIILKSDPVAKYYNYLSNEICEITKNKINVGIITSYRLVQ